MWWIYAFVLVFALGTPAAVVLAYSRNDRRFALVPIAAFLTLAIGTMGYYSYPVAKSHSQANTVGGYRENFNGSLIDAQPEVTECHEDGRCVHEDHYCDEWDTYEDIKDSNNKVIGQRKVEHYHDCPQMSEEISYYVLDAFGNKYYLAQNIFAANPHPWRSHDVNMSGSGSVPRGVPADWQKLKDQIDAEDAPAVSVDHIYDNIVLGYESKQAHDAEPDIKILKDAKLLPPLNYPIHDQYKVDKVQFVGMSAPSNKATWLDYAMRFNASFGMTLQGDLHIVVLKASAFQSLGLDPADYIRSIKAYWQSDADFGKEALPKNAVIAALAVDDSGTNVVWARAETGMPIGNHELLDYIANRFDDPTPVAFSPDAVLGKTTASIVEQNGKPKAVYSVGNGVLSQALMVDMPFKRACMKCKSSNDKGQVGFVDLQSLIPISGWATFWAIVIMLLISAALGGVSIAGYSFFTGATAFEGFRTTDTDRTTLYSSYPY